METQRFPPTQKKFWAFVGGVLDEDRQLEGRYAQRVADEAPEASIAGWKGPPLRAGPSPVVSSAASREKGLLGFCFSFLLI